MRPQTTRLFCVFVLLLLGASARAGDHLEPDTSAFERDGLYGAFNAELFFEAFAEGAQARVIVIPSFEPEYAVWISVRNGTSRIISSHPEAPLESYDPEKLAGANPNPEPLQPGSPPEKEDALLTRFVRGIKLVRCEVVIEPGLAQRIARIWEEMLLQTRYDRPIVTINARGQTIERIRVVADGTAYHFSMSTGIHDWAGYVGSPSDGTVTGDLVRITDAMRKLCQTHDWSVKPELTRLTENLLRRLGK